MLKNSDPERRDESLPKFSFNIPTYNASEHLESCLKSIFSQDYPHERIEVLIADGGSSDDTIEIATKYPIKLLHNPRRLVDYASKINAANATGDLLVAFAADNDLGSRNWLSRVAQVFQAHPEVSAFWCDMIASESDPRINKYYELIKSDPMTAFLNKNLQWYLKNSKSTSIDGESYHAFRVRKDRSLVWGANGMVFRTNLYKPIMLRGEYIGDNDVFQEMVENGHDVVAFSPTLKVYHHHLKSFQHWMKKWERNYRLHTLSHLETRKMNWMGIENLRARLLLWFPYSLIPMISLSHSAYLSVRDKNINWLYQPPSAFFQSYFLLKETLGSKEGIRMIRSILSGRGLT